jgi:hypothetical protein
MTVISYPIPPYSNVPIQPQFYQPSRFVISGVSFGNSTTITTSANVNYVIGQQVRLLIPPSFGCIQLNESQGYVLSIPAPNQVVLSIDSSKNVDPFIASSSKIEQAQILAIGDINSGFISSTGRSVPITNGNTQTQIPGSFINISPFEV